MKSNVFLPLTLIATSLLTACGSDSDSSSSQGAYTTDTLISSAQTKTSYEDIGDGAYWQNPQDKSETYLFATLEGDGLAAYDAQGTETLHLENIEPTGADVRYQLASDLGETVDLLALALPEESAIGFYSIATQNNQLQLTDIGRLDLDMAAEGVCMYKNPTNGQLLLTAISEAGVAAQYKMHYQDGSIQSVLTDSQGMAIAARSLNIGGELSACIVDDASATLYIAEQDVGVWAYGADPEDINSRQLVDGIAPLGHLGEIEGLDYVYLEDGQGYLVVGDEANGLTLYQSEDWQFKAQYVPEGFEVVKSLITGTDGLWLANTELAQPVYEKITYTDLNQTSMLAAAPIVNPLTANDIAKADAALVTVHAETEPVEDDGDAADDPAFWYNQDAPQESLIIATNKQGGLVAYNLQGETLQYLDQGEPNNVDIIQSVNGYTSTPIALAAASDRTNNSIALYQIQAPNSGAPVIQSLSAVGDNTQSGQLLSELNEVYGLCMYQADDGTPYVFMNGKSGEIEQWRLTVSSGEISGEIVRRLSVPSQPEGCVSDPTRDRLYVGEEDEGIWMFEASEYASTEGQMIIQIDGKNLVDDVEGLSIYEANGERYLLASSQGNHTYAVYDLEQEHTYLGSFALVADDQNGLDGASETDGIHAVSYAIDGIYPEGFFIAQDGYNVNDLYEQENQNFKLADWRDIISALNE